MNVELEEIEEPNISKEEEYMKLSLGEGSLGKRGLPNPSKMVYYSVTMKKSPYNKISHMGTLLEVHKVRTQHLHLSYAILHMVQAIL